MNTPRPLEPQQNGDQHRSQTPDAGTGGYVVPAEAVATPAARHPSRTAGIANLLVIMVVFAGVRQRELARVLDVSASQLSRYLAGLSTAPEKIRRRIAFLFCVPPSMFFHETPIAKALQHLLEVWLPHDLRTARQRLREAGCTLHRQ
jgi:hypothetical protein